MATQAHVAAGASPASLFPNASAQWCSSNSNSTSNQTNPRLSNLQIAISTNGQGCRLAGRIKRDLIAGKVLSKDVGGAVGQQLPRFQGFEARSQPAPGRVGPVRPSPIEPHGRLPSVATRETASRTAGLRHRPELNLRAAVPESDDRPAGKILGSPTPRAGRGLRKEVRAEALMAQRARLTSPISAGTGAGLQAG